MLVYLDLKYVFMDLCVLTDLWWSLQTGEGEGTQINPCINLCELLDSMMENGNYGIAWDGKDQMGPKNESWHRFHVRDGYIVLTVRAEA